MWILSNNHFLLIFETNILMVWIRKQAVDLIWIEKMSCTSTKQVQILPKNTLFHVKYSRVLGNFLEHPARL